MTLITSTAARHEDLRDVVAKIAQERNDKILQLFLIQDQACTDYTHKWADKTLMGYKDVITADVTNSGTTFAVAAGAQKRIINGQTYAKIDDEIVLVTAGSGSNSLTVTRAQQSTTGVAHTAGTEIFFIEHVHDEGADNSRDDSQVASKTTNVTQIFRRELKLSGTSQAVNSVGQDTLWANQVSELLPEMMAELRLAALHSKQTVDGDESLRTMGGLFYYVTNAIDEANSAVTTEMLDSKIEQLLDSGANPNDLVLLAPTRQIRKINALKIARVVGGGMDPKDTTIRNNVDQYEFSDALVRIVRVPELARNEMYIGERGKFKIVPLQKRAFHVEDIGKVGDSVQKLLIGEYTCEVMNATKSWIRMKNLAV
jgi:hypothetical protein